MTKKFFAFLLGTVATYLTAVILVTQFNIARVTEFGYPVSFTDRLETTLHDIGGMLGVYLPLIAIALLIAWLFTGLLLTRFIKPSTFLYALAGFTGIVALHVIMQAALGMSGVAPTRTLLGLLGQGIAGAVGGWAFYKIAYSSQQATK